MGVVGVGVVGEGVAGVGVSGEGEAGEGAVGEGVVAGVGVGAVVGVGVLMGQVHGVQEGRRETRRFGAAASAELLRKGSSACGYALGATVAGTILAVACEAGVA